MDSWEDSIIHGLTVVGCFGGRFYVIYDVSWLPASLQTVVAKAWLR